MKIVTWNCNGALRKKLAEVDSLNADVLIIQECEDPRQSTKAYQTWAGDYLWIGDSKSKGIGIFPKNKNFISSLNWSGNFEIHSLLSNSSSKNWHTEDLKLFLPFSLNKQFTILACWTKGKDFQVFGYIGQFWKYLQIHRQELKQENTIILGDFNSNSIWDKDDRWWSHTDTVNELTEIGIHSLYHKKNNESQGSETEPTFFHQRNEAKPYHIDYVFLSNSLIENSTLEIGKKLDWIKVSDHLPLSVDLVRSKT